MGARWSANTEHDDGSPSSRSRESSWVMSLAYLRISSSNAAGYLLRAARCCAMVSLSLMARRASISSFWSPLASMRFTVARNSRRSA
eukprot:6212706-Pleurochrysis_carterae.AAC.2